MIWYKLLLSVCNTIMGFNRSHYIIKLHCIFLYFRTLQILFSLKRLHFLLPPILLSEHIAKRVSYFGQLPKPELMAIILFLLYFYIANNLCLGFSMEPWVQSFQQLQPCQLQKVHGPSFTKTLEHIMPVCDYSEGFTCSLSGHFLCIKRAYHIIWVKFIVYKYIL